MKFVTYKLIIIFYIILTSRIEFITNSKLKSKIQLMMKTKLQTFTVINDELDSLINFLEKSPNKQHKDEDFNDKILNAFQSLNHDFLEYDDLLSDTPTEVKQLLYNNEKNYSLLCKNHENRPNENFYNEAEDLTKQIEESIHSISKIEQNEDDQQEIKLRLNKINEIRKKLQVVKEQLDQLKTQKDQVHQNIESVRSSFSCLFNMYDRLLDNEKEIKGKYDKELNEIKNQFDESEEKKMKIKNYLELINRLEAFNYRISNTQGHSDKSRYIEDLINQLNHLEKSSEIIKHKIKIQIDKIKNNSSLPIHLRLKKMNKVIAVLNKLRIMNKKVLKMKTQIGEKLKQLSMNSLQELTNYIKDKQTLNKNTHNKLKHLRDVLNIGHNIFKNKKRLDLIKNRIKENIEQAENNIFIKNESLKRDRYNYKLNQIKIKRENIEHLREKLIQRYLSIHAYINQLKRLKDIFHKARDRIAINKKLLISQRKINELKKIINNSREIVSRLKQNNHTQINYEKSYQLLIGEIRNLKIEIDESSDMDNMKLDLLQKKLMKLADLYKYIKKGSIHNFIRNELMKKIVNMNDTIMHQFDINKLIIQAKFNK